MFRTIADQANRLWNGDLTPFGAPPIDDYTAGRLRAEQIGNVVRYTPAMMMANIFNAIVMVVAMWETPMAAPVHLWASR